MMAFAVDSTPHGRFLLTWFYGNPVGSWITISIVFSLCFYFVTRHALRSFSQEGFAVVKGQFWWWLRLTFCGVAVGVGVGVISLEVFDSLRLKYVLLGWLASTLLLVVLPTGRGRLVAVRPLIAGLILGFGTFLHFLPEAYSAQISFLFMLERFSPGGLVVWVGCSWIFLGLAVQIDKATPIPKSGSVLALVTEGIVRRTNRFFSLSTKVFHLTLLGIVVTYLIVADIIILNTQPFLGSGFLIEQLLEFTAGLNFATHGFLSTGFISDYSPYTGDGRIPYLYTHQPNLPAVIIGFLLEIFSDPTYLRLVFAVFSAFGVGAFCLFIKEVTNSPATALLSSLVLVFGDLAQLTHASHFVLAFFFISVFGSLYCYTAGQISGRRLYLFGYAVFVGLAALTNTMAITVVVAAQIMLHFWWKPIRPSVSRSRFNLTGLSVLAAAAAMIIVRNIVGLGFEVAYLDLIYTLNNRIFGTPSVSELMQFYRANDIVLWGVTTFSVSGLFSWIFSHIRSVISELWFAVLVIVFFSASMPKVIFRHASGSLNPFVLIALGLSFYTWHLLFFAQGSIYLSQFFSQIFPSLFTSFVLSVLITYWKHCDGDLTPTAAENHISPRQNGRLLLLAAGIFFTTFTILGHSLVNLSTMLSGKSYRNSNIAVNSLRQLTTIPLEGSIWTNIDSNVLNFFLPAERIAGGCGLETLVQGRLGSRCRSTFRLVDDSERPKYIFLAENWVPGYNTRHSFEHQRIQLEQMPNIRILLTYAPTPLEPMWILYQLH